MEGFVVLPRAYLDWEWHDNPETFTVYVHLLMLARFAPGAWRGVQLESGQLITSLGHLAKLCGLSVQQTRTALDRLRTAAKVTSKSTNKYTLVTIVDWEVEQEIAKKATSTATDNQQTNNKQITNEQQQRNHGNHGTMKPVGGRARDGGDETTSLAVCLEAAKRAGIALNASVMDKLTALHADYGKDWLLMAIDRASDRGKNSVDYVKAILESWRRKGRVDSAKPNAPADGGLEETGGLPWLY